MNIQFAGSIQKVQTLVDGGNKLVIETQELSPDDMSKLFSLKGMMWVCLSDVAVKPEDLNIKEVRLDSPKTPSERLRNVLFVYWNQNKPTDTFDEFYNRKMSDITEWIKSKLV